MLITRAGCAKATSSSCSPAAAASARPPSSSRGTSARASSRPSAPAKADRTRALGAEQVFDHYAGDFSRELRAPHRRPRRRHRHRARRRGDLGSQRARARDRRTPRDLRRDDRTRGRRSICVTCSRASSRCSARTWDASPSSIAAAPLAVRRPRHAGHRRGLPARARRRRAAAARREGAVREDRADGKLIKAFRPSELLRPAASVQVAE